MEDGTVIFIGNKPVMNYVLAVVTQFNTTSIVTLKARGQSISRAVDTAEIIRNKFMLDLDIEDIIIGTNIVPDEHGHSVNVSSIDIVLTNNVKASRHNPNDKGNHNFDKMEAEQASNQNETSSTNKLNQKTSIKNFTATPTVEKAKHVNSPTSAPKNSTSIEQSFQNNELKNELNISHSKHRIKNKKNNKKPSEMQRQPEKSRYFKYYTASAETSSVSSVKKSEFHGNKLDKKVTDLVKTYKTVDRMKDLHVQLTCKPLFEHNKLKKLKAYTMEVQQLSSRCDVIAIFKINNNQPIIRLPKHIWDTLKPIGGHYLQTNKYRGWLMPKELTIKAVDALAKLDIVDKNDPILCGAKYSRAINNLDDNEASTKIIDSKRMIVADKKIEMTENEKKSKSSRWTCADKSWIPQL
jgi:DNA-binding protein